MKKVISFTLYGSIPKYCIGAIKNAEIAQKLFPDFFCIFYLDSTVPEKIVSRLKGFSNSQIRYINCESIPLRMYRYLAIDEPDVELFISRDTDSRLSLREKSVIDNWIKGDKNYILIKDNPFYHRTPEMLAGMWGMKKIYGFSMRSMIFEWMEKYSINDLSDVSLDQKFLSDVMYPKIQSDLAYYDNYNLNALNGALRIDFKRDGYRYVGEIFNEYDEPDVHWKAIREYRLKQIPIMGKVIAQLLTKIGL